MKAILINPFTRSVSEVEYSGNIQEIYDMLNCGTFTVLGGKIVEQDIAPSWRDMDEATFEQGFWSWLTRSYTVRIGHRFTKGSEIRLTEAR